MALKRRRSAATIMLDHRTSVWSSVNVTTTITIGVTKKYRDSKPLQLRQLPAGDPSHGEIAAVDPQDVAQQV